MLQHRNNKQSKCLPLSLSKEVRKITLSKINPQEFKLMLEHGERSYAEDARLSHLISEGEHLSLEVKYPVKTQEDILDQNRQRILRDSNDLQCQELFVLAETIEGRYSVNPPSSPPFINKGDNHIYFGVRFHRIYDTQFRIRLGDKPEEKKPLPRSDNTKVENNECDSILKKKNNRKGDKNNNRYLFDNQPFNNILDDACHSLEASFFQNDYMSQSPMSYIKPHFPNGNRERLTRTEIEDLRCIFGYSITYKEFEVWVITNKKKQFDNF